MALFEARLLPWPQVKQLAQQGAVALLPIGSTEAHGPHLPLSVDVVIAEEVCRRVAPRLPGDAVMFPAVAYSLTDFAAPFAGTVTLGAQVAQHMLEAILGGIVMAGLQTTLVINHHLEPAHFRLVHQAAKAVLGTPAATGKRVLVVDHRRAPTGPLLGEEFMHGGSHAGCYETSLMLAAAPQLVDRQRLAELPELEINLPQVIKDGAQNFLECGGADAYFGSPSTATAQEGERLFSLLVEATLATFTGTQAEGLALKASSGPKREG